MKTMLKRILSLSLLVVMCLSMTVHASAANACASIGGSAKTSQTFTVNTGARWIAKTDTITLKQTKGTMEYTNIFAGTSSMRTYGYYVVTVYQGNKTVQTLKWYGSSSLKIKNLERNTTYRVTVTPKTATEISDICLGKSFFAFIRYQLGGFMWDDYATWRVSSTKGIISCSSY